MPTYEYICLSCARRVDVLHGIHADGPTTCEACGGTLRKAISAAAVVFKGSGWAKKDAARAATRPSSENSDGTAKDSDGPKETAPVRGNEAGTDRAPASDVKSGTPENTSGKEAGSIATAPVGKGPSDGGRGRGSTSPRSGG